MTTNAANKRYFLSFDCGNKALGYVLLSTTDVTYSPINDIIKIEDTNIELLSYDVIDLIPGQKLKDTDDIMRVKALKRALDRIDISIVPKDMLTVIVEYQMGPNVKSHSVFDGIFMYYADYNICKITPSYKNKICFCEEGRHQRFLEKSAQSYTANKAHTSFNVKYYCRQKKVDISKIPDKVIKDFADAFMQIIAWLTFVDNNTR